MTKAISRIFHFAVDEDEVPKDVELGAAAPRAKFRLPPQGLYNWAMRFCQQLTDEEQEAINAAHVGETEPREADDYFTATLLSVSITRLMGEFEKYAADSVLVEPGDWPEGRPNDEEVIRKRVTFIVAHLAMSDQLRLMKHLMAQLGMSGGERGESDAPAA